MDICSEEYFELSRDEYLKIKEFMNNNIDTLNLCSHLCMNFLIYIKKCYNHCNCTCSYYSENDFVNVKNFVKKIVLL